MLLKAPRVRKCTKTEYYKAADLGWFGGQRVELIDGEVIEMAPQKDAHVSSVSLADYALRKVFGDGYTIRVQAPVDFGTHTQPEPDIVAVKGSPRTVLKHPKTALLVVEVSETTLGHDRSKKARLYASRGIGDYWIVNLVKRQLDVYRKPVADAAEPFGHKYDEVIPYLPGESVAPLAARRSKVKVSDLLP